MRRTANAPQPERRRPAALVAAGAFGCLLVVAAAALAAPAHAEKRAELKRVEGEIKSGQARKAALEQKAKAIDKEIAALRARMVAAARTVQNGETALSRLEDELRGLRAREGRLRIRFAARQADLARTLAALQRLSINPPESLIAYPATAGKTVRSAILLKRYLPYLEKRVAPLRRQLAELTSVRKEIAARRRAVVATNRRLAGDRERLSAMLATRSGLKRTTDREHRAANAKLRALAARARDLKDLVGRVRANRRRAQVAMRRPPTAPRLRKPDGMRLFSSARGRIVAPIRGRIIRKFGEQTGFGSFTKGVVLQSRLGAQVVAPFDGQVVFAGPFRGYGQILIIEHSEGYHTLLAGLARIDIILNQWLLGGEPIGAMSSTQSHRTRLYMEIRRKGQPINPLPWLAAQPNRVNG